MTAPAPHFADANKGGSGATVAYVPDPGALAADEIAYMAIAVSSANTVTTPSGWTLLAGPFTTTSGGTDAKVYIFKHVGEPSTWDFPLGSTGPFSAAMVTVTGADTSSPEDATQSSVASAASTTRANTGVTTTDADRLIIHFCLARHQNANTWTTPSGFAEPTGGQDSNTTHSAQVATKTQASAGATGTITSTAAESTARIVSYVIAVKPTSATSAGDEEATETVATADSADQSMITPDAVPVADSWEVTLIAPDDPPVAVVALTDIAYDRLPAYMREADGG